MRTLKRPRFLACKTCEDRFIGCHSSRCPHGWSEYEKRYMEYMVIRGIRAAATIAAAEIKEARLRSVLASKDRRKYWLNMPIR